MPSRAHDQELDGLHEVEAGMTHHRRDNRPSAQVDDPPERSQSSGRNSGVDPLQQMSDSEGDACDDQTEGRAAERQLEPMKQESPLKFFPDAAGDDHDERKHPGIPRCPHQPFERIGDHGVERRRSAPEAIVEILPCAIFERRPR